MKHCNACGADSETSTEPGWMRFELGGLEITGGPGRATAIVPEITMVACAKDSVTVLAQFNRKRAQRETWLRTWLESNAPTRIETLDPPTPISD